MKKIVAMALTGIVAAGLLTGCRRGNNNTTTPSTVPSTAPIVTVPSTMPTVIPTMPSTDVTTTPTDGDMWIDPSDVTDPASTQNSTDITGESSRSYRRGNSIG